MSRTNNILDFLDAGIRAETLRQKSIANNIANTETPNYRRSEVKFEDILAKSLKSDGSADVRNLEPEVSTPKNTPVNAKGNDVSLESELGDLIENSIKYKAYVRMLNKKYEQIALAMDVK